jgi:hypothetical protein
VRVCAYAQSVMSGCMRAACARGVCARRVRAACASLCAWDVTQTNTRTAEICSRWRVCSSVAQKRPREGVHGRRHVDHALSACLLLHASGSSCVLIQKLDDALAALGEQRRQPVELVERDVRECALKEVAPVGKCHVAHQARHRLRVCRSVLRVQQAAQVVGIRCEGENPIVHTRTRCT